MAEQAQWAEFYVKTATRKYFESICTFLLFLCLLGNSFHHATENELNAVNKAICKFNLQLFLSNQHILD